MKKNLMFVLGAIGLVAMLSCGGESTQEVIENENEIVDIDTTTVEETDTISDESFFDDAKDSTVESN